MSIADMVRLAGAARAEYDDRVRTAQFDLAIYFGVPAHGPNRHSQLVVRATDLERMKAQAIYPDVRPLYRRVDQVFGIPVVDAPDWTFDPLAVATARALALGRILARRITGRWVHRAQQG